jgi:hypothetical protein
LPALQKTF